MVTFYETDLHEDKYNLLTQDEKQKYTKYEYYSNTQTNSNVWNAGDDNDTPVNLYVLKPGIPLDYPFIPPSDEQQLSIQIEAAWVELRKMRTKALVESDWTQIRDVTLSEEKVNEWIAYRQALRDLPSNTEDPTNPVWPEAPN
jgi:hypothetical protein